MNILKFIKFNEAKLTLQDLDKPGKNGDRKRGDTLVKKFKHGPKPKEKRMVLTDGGEKYIKVNQQNVISAITNIVGDYDSNKAKDFFKDGNRYSDKIELSDGSFIGINDIEKTTEFGSPTYGSVKTRNVESLQCVYLSYKQYLYISKSKKQKVLPETYSEIIDNLNVLEPFFKIPINISKLNIEKLVNDFGQDDEWLNTLVTTSNSLYSDSPLYSGNQPVALNRSKRYIFVHSGTPIGRSIYKKFRDLTDYTLTVQDNKWMPCDIWAIDESMLNGDEIIGIDNCLVYDDLLEFINDNFRKRKIVGISLKKLEKDKSTVIVNGETYLPSYKYIGYNISKPLGKSMSIDLYATEYYDGEIEKGVRATMTLRSKASTGKVDDISCEVVGKKSRLGGINVKIINQILEREGSEYLINTNSDIKEETNGEHDKDILILSIKRSYEEIDPTTKVDYDQFQNYELKKLMSLYQSIELVAIIEELKRKKDRKSTNIINRIVQSMFYSCLSIHYLGNMDDKEYTRTPMYIRII